MDAVRYYWLSTHLTYRCRDSGACCTAGWPIPIERTRAAAVQAAIDAGGLRAPQPWCHPDPHAPPEVAGVLRRQRSNACVFHRPDAGAPVAGGCAIHPMRPAACEHFPYACVLDPRGVHVTLSHFCPTAAGLLFDAEGPVEVVSGPALREGGRLPEGLDARDALPPAGSAAPPRLLSWDQVSAWESALVARLAGGPAIAAPPCLADFDRARAAVPPPWVWPAAPPACCASWEQLVGPAWARWSAAIGRYLAAKAHASWAMCLGEGPRSVVRSVDLARTVLQVEATRACAAAGRGLDRALLTAAIRQSDLLLMHLADPRRLVDALPGTA